MESVAGNQVDRVWDSGVMRTEVSASRPLFSGTLNADPSLRHCVARKSRRKQGLGELRVENSRSILQSNECKAKDHSRGMRSLLMICNIL